MNCHESSHKQELLSKDPKTLEESYIHHCLLLLLQPRQLISTGCWLWMHWYAAGCNAAVQHIQASESLLDGCYYFSRMSYCIGYFLASYSSYLVEADSGLPVCQFSCSVDWFVTLYPNPAVNGETHGCVLSLNGGSQAGRSMCRGMQ